MNNHLTGRAIVVTASSRGLGKAVALAFASKGDRVMLFGRNSDALEITSKEIEKITGNKPLYTVGDMSVVQDIEQLVYNSVQSFGKIDVLYNNTGRPIRGAFSSLSDKEWLHSFEETFLSYIRTIRLFLPHMPNRNKGYIVNNLSASIFSLESTEGYYFSNTFRSALVGFTDILADDLRKKDILINGVAPRKIREQSEEDRGDTTTIRKTPKDYADLVMSLCSPHNTSITGQLILIG